jgi:peptide/nickel transport system substrate-binding protein
VGHLDRRQGGHLPVAQGRHFPQRRALQRPAKWNLERGAAEGTKNAHPEFFRIIEKIETPDESTLKLTLKNPDSLFIVHMAEGDAVMLPMKGYENTAAHPIGTGPFKFVEWKATA